MSLSRRLRNIAKTQLNNLKDRLDKADEEADFNDAARQAEVDAANELNDPADMRLARRSTPHRACTVAESGESLDDTLPPLGSGRRGRSRCR